ncbi:MAG: hypothetical protein HZY74_03170 [Brevundimonas sp.]|nr:MAG: hypothetical protein HZY74_03170 [Brevundimonas sp.]
MPLVEIARFTDVYEADLAAAFLSSQGIDVEVTERFQTTVDPLMQRALGIRLLAHDVDVAQARDLLARVRVGEFADPDETDLEPLKPVARAGITLAGLILAGLGGFWGTSLPRRLRNPNWVGIALVGGAITFVLVFLSALISALRAHTDIL